MGTRDAEVLQTRGDQAEDLVAARGRFDAQPAAADQAV
jgi:hypothetical protein